MPYIQLAATIVSVGVLAWLADLVTGRRSLPNMMMVALTGGAAGAFLAVRVFAVSNHDSWIWPLWSAAGAVLSLLIYFLFRNKR